ncbi:hypothetical protein AQUCO_00400627v1 [Aquilegia coerulea]|uniref:Uncharacterized protein n=1 Tax=Aquilegia coerulea TaxID=218851 RepID=A0A2G5EVU6_AQUCA|nr:hypothetical protein AQUCO_00400627v1 [Aquilegia coerulea]
MQGLEDEGVDLMILVTSYSGKLAACMLRGLQSASSSTSNLVMAFEFEELFCSERKTMEGTSVLNSNSFISSKPHLLKFTFFDSFSTPLRQHTHFHLNHKTNSNKRMTSLLVSPRTSLLSPALALVAETIQKAVVTSSSPSLTKDVFPKIDKSGRFCSPRAARELALSIAYAACLEGSDPVRLFDKRVNAKREPGYEFNKSTLVEYNHMNFAGDAVATQTEEEAEEMLRIVERESAIDAEVLSAPPKLVYSKLILRLTKKMLVAVVEGWDSHVLVIDKVAPQNWKVCD